MIKSQLCNTVPPQMGLVYLLSPVGSLSALLVCVLTFLYFNPSVSLYVLPHFTPFKPS